MKSSVIRPCILLVSILIPTAIHCKYERVWQQDEAMQIFNHLTSSKEMQNLLYQVMEHKAEMWQAGLDRKAQLESNKEKKATSLHILGYKMINLGNRMEPVHGGNCTVHDKRASSKKGRAKMTENGKLSQSSGNMSRTENPPVKPYTQRSTASLEKQRCNGPGVTKNRSGAKDEDQVRTSTGSSAGGDFKVPDGVSWEWTLIISGVSLLLVAGGAGTFFWLRSTKDDDDDEDDDDSFISNE